LNRILISGYYGFGNAGDEAVLAAMLASLRRQSPGVQCRVLSAAPEITSQLHAIPASHRARPREVLQALRRCDLFVSGGGSLLQDVTSLNSLFFYLAQIVLARALRRRVLIYAQGIGPLRHPAARRLTTSVLRRTNWITVRDAESAAELARLGLAPGKPPVEITADPVFGLHPAPAEWAREELRPLLPSPRPPLLGISVRAWPGLDERLPALADAIRHSAEAHGLTPVYFPLQRQQDEPACRRLAEHTGGCVLPGEYRPAEWMALAGEMDLFLGMRLHALIFAAARGVPVVGLSYDPKVTALLARIGGSPGLSLEAFDAAALRRALRDTWNEREQWRVQLAGTARELAVAAEVNAQRAAELLGVSLQPIEVKRGANSC
jgi:polysaccharide pyruvyl transferase CsaB